MPEPTTTKEVFEALNKAFEEFKTINDKRIEQLETRGVVADDVVEKFLKLESEMANLEDMQERIGLIEAKANLPQRDGSDNEHALPEDVEHARAWDEWIRNPKHPDSIRARDAAAAAAAAVDRPRFDKYGRMKAVTITGTAGGNAIPTLIHDRIVSKIYDLSPIRRIANVANASNENHRFVVMDNNSTGGWAAAGDSRTETVTPLFQAVTLTYGTAYAYPQVQEEAMDDLAMDVSSLIENTAARVLAQQEGVAFVTGNGTARPTGFLNGGAVSPLTIVVTGDEASPQRPFGSVQYLPTGAAAGFQADIATVRSPITDPTGVLIDTVYALKAEYRNAAQWVVNKATLAAVRKLRDGEGNYLWAVGIAPGEPSTLLGYGVVEAEAMPDLAAAAHVMAFADWDQAYQIGDIVSSMRMTLDDNITSPGFVKFYIRRRLGGNLLNDDAIKIVKCSVA